ncbi:MAG: hypothetical protein AAFP26_03600 [Planctomycetota bacterium]
MTAARGETPANPIDERRDEVASPRARCVVVHRPGAGVPRALADALARQQLDHTALDSPVRALAELCITGRAGGRPAILLLDEPDRLEDPVKLVRAAQRYAGRAVCWQYRAAAHPQLSAILDRDLDAWSSARAEPQPELAPKSQPEPQPSSDQAHVQAEDAQQAPPAGLRLTHSGPQATLQPADHARPGLDAGVEGEAPQRLLTSEELAMLFNGSGRAAEGREP